VTAELLEAAGNMYCDDELECKVIPQTLMLGAANQIQ